MHRIRTILAALLALGAVAVGAASLWRRNRRIGTGFVNSVVNPGMMGRGLAGGRSSEIGVLEHIGRRSGVRRLTLVHPEPTPEGFRIMVPLGAESQWARNVIAAGHCRLQVHGLVYELDEPAMIPAAMVPGIPAVVQGVQKALGFQYLLLRRFGVATGTLEAAAPETETFVAAEKSERAVTDQPVTPTAIPVSA